MFYPVQYLKKGGRFYLCWVADSWPLRFATITHRQLWSQDIRNICDDLLDVMNNESGRPGKRFSLRLSSQLMRGLVRLYQRKVVVFLSDLCMINSRVFKSSNKKWNVHEPVEGIEEQLFPQVDQQLLPVVELQAPVQEVLAENAERIEEMIQQSGNIVSNIQDITLREATIPEHQLAPNDGFGEEHPDQALQHLQDRTLEQMLGGVSGSALHSGLDLPTLDLTEKSNDKSRLVVEKQMERISDVSLYRKSTAQDILPEEFEKDVPHIPELPPPDLLVPSEKEQPVPLIEVTSIAGTLEVEKDKNQQNESEKGTAAVVDIQPVELELEELEELEPAVKRRRLKDKLIVDKKIKLSGHLFRARLDNIAIELRCEDSTDDIVDLRVPVDILFSRPSHAGHRFRTNLCPLLTRLFARNLAPMRAVTRAEREIEEIRVRSRHSPVRTNLEIIPEEPQPVLDPQILAPIEEPNVNESALLMDLRVSILPDISDLPTQKLETLSQLEIEPRQMETSSQQRKRAADQDGTPKRQRHSGFVSFRQNRLTNIEARDKEVVEKENIPDNQQILLEFQPIQDIQPIIPELDLHAHPEQTLTSMLQKAGLADLQTQMNEIEEEIVTQRKRRHDSDSSETPLGSLDRTKVSLGDSVKTTDSKRFIRDQWGTEGTMEKILKSIKNKNQPLTVGVLISHGPIIAGYKSIIAARCFTSILKLKQHGFIKVTKDPNNLEIQDIFLGPKFDLI